MVHLPQPRAVDVELHPYLDESVALVIRPHHHPATTITLTPTEARKVHARLATILKELKKK